MEIKDISIDRGRVTYTVPAATSPFKMLDYVDIGEDGAPKPAEMDVQAAGFVSAVANDWSNGEESFTVEFYDIGQARPAFNLLLNLHQQPA